MLEYDILMILTSNVKLKDIYKRIMWYFKHPSKYISQKYQQGITSPGKTFINIYCIFLWLIDDQ